MTLKTKAFGDIITFTRASGGGRFNSSGVYEWVTNDVPRFDYDPVTLQPRGLLIEEARTNLLLQSEAFDSASWAKNWATVVANAAAAPDGTLTADKLVEDTTATIAHSINQVASVTPGAVYTYTVYAKSGERNWLCLVVGTGADFTASWFDLSLGEKGAGTGSIEAVGNDWYRCSFTVTSSAAILNAYALVVDANGNQNYTGDGTSGLYIWGAQLETGAFPTSYIPTEASQVTRAADVCSVNTLSPWYNPEQGTLVVEGEITSRTTPRVSADIGAGGAFGTTLYLAHDGSATYAAPPVAPVNTFASVPDTALTFKSALAMRKNGMTVASNGVLGSTDVLCEMPMAPNKLTIGKGGWSGGDSSLNGHIKSLRYYPRKLSDSELQAITS